MNPLFKIDRNKLTSLSGEVSAFFKIVSQDLEGMDSSAQDRVFTNLEDELRNTKATFKLYSLNSELYLNSFEETNLSSVSLKAENDPLKLFKNNETKNVTFYENYFEDGFEFKRLLSVVDFPVNLARLTCLEWPDFVLNFQIIDRIKAKNKVNLKRKLHFANLFKNMKDIESENAYVETESIYDELTTNTKSLFCTELFFILKANTKHELDLKTSEFIYEFQCQGGKLLIEARGLSYFYQSLIPGVMPSYKRSFDITSDYLSYLFPIHRDYLMEEGIKLTSLRDKKVFLDLFDPASLNYNVLITGSSGQGKSVLAGYILRENLKSGIKAVVLDLGNSFEKNAQYHGANILSQRFNPLQFKDPRYVKEFILAAIPIDEKLSKKDEGKLFSVLKELLPAHQNGFVKLLNTLESDFKGISFYFKELEEFFCDEHIPLNDFTYCNFDSYPQSMKSPLVIYLIQYFKELEGKKIFIFDECWHLLNQNAEYIAECFRTFRKYQASAVAISQNLDDFSESQLGRVIIQNTYYKFLFKQSLKKSEFIDEISINLMDEIQSKKGVYSEFLYLSESFKKPLRFYADPFEYELFTSDREDKCKFEHYLEEKGKYLGFKDALINFVKIKNPQWSTHE